MPQTVWPSRPALALSTGGKDEEQYGEIKEEGRRKITHMWNKWKAETNVKKESIWGK
jgi:hypothetical protein